MKIHISLIPEEFINLYNLREIVAEDGFIYIKIRGGMYGSPQAGYIAHKQLVKHLQPFGYELVKFTLGLWTNKKKNITFILVVDNFGIKFNFLQDFMHLAEALQTRYTITINLLGLLYIGIKLD